MALPFCIQIPIFNETEALLFSHYYFSKLDLLPTYILDSQSSLVSRNILATLGENLRFFENDKPFIENGYQAFAEAAPVDWILRLDCDEVASMDVIEFCTAHARQDGDAVVSFERHQLLTDGNCELLTTTSERFLPKVQRQYRFFNRRKVSFNRTIHTPGIDVASFVDAPSQAALFHFSWIFLSGEQRREKALRYDAHGQRSGNRDNQLFDLRNAQTERLNAPFLTQTYSEWLNSREKAAGPPESPAP